ncbi:LabA-like NYN domain-containing protein [Nitrincola sp. A-D6]|uniref:LabA-like NYN domain-containing protein n=1 Tax=Nitrincola sp. A-D6 TaxID=1545442 RepID=UPI00068DB8A9|nr:NYN domain-containing protein [Nitrincola sp. A-D6]
MYSTKPREAPLTRIAIFADVQNIYYTTRQVFGRQFNYRAFWQQASELGEIVAATAYAIDRGDPQQQKFQEALRHIGFEVKLKPYIQRGDGSAKGDWDVGITIDALLCAGEVDQVILLSGDGDFDLLLHTLRDRYQVRSHLFSVPGLTAQSLIKSADKWIAIDAALLQ